MTELGKPQSRTELRNVIAMAIPMVITTSSRALMDVADYVMITGLGLAEAQAAILPAQLIMWSYIVIGMGILSMVNTFAAQSLGRGQHRECSAFGWQSLYLAAIVGVIALVARPSLPALFALFGHDPVVQTMELAYARVALLTVMPTLAAAGLGWFFIGVHRPGVTMWSVIEANVVNVMVSCVLIYGYLGFESMGIAGAAWGTLAGVTYRAIRLTLTLIAPKMNRMYASRHTWRPSLTRIKKLVRVGFPRSVHWVSEVVVWAIFVNVLVGTKFGTAHLIATSAAWQYLRLSFMPAIGVGQALTALVGKSIGGGDPNRAIRETRIVARITLVYMGVLSLVYGVFGSELIGWFSGDPQVIAIGGRIMICAAVFQLFDALGITYSSALAGAGDTYVPSAMFVVAAWVVLAGGGWVAATFYPELGSLGPWIAAAAFIVSTGIFLCWRWGRLGWVNIKLFDEQASGETAPEAAAGAAEPTVAESFAAGSSNG